VCLDGVCECLPTCVDQECGGDGCGGQCGLCDAGTSCVFGQCQCAPICGGLECGPDSCGGSCGLCDVGLACDAGFCVPAETIYTAVFVLDAWQVGDSCSQFGSSGADIDSVQLFNCPGQDWDNCQPIGFFEETVASVGTETCNNGYQDPETAIGAVDGAYIALQGGYVAGEFGPVPPISSGNVIRVHEFGAAYGGSDDPYDVFLLTDLDCLSTDDPNECSLYVGNGTGLSDFLVP
jgi:hypothetical protein